MIPSRFRFVRLLTLPTVIASLASLPFLACDDNTDINPVPHDASTSADAHSDAPSDGHTDAPSDANADGSSDANADAPTDAQASHDAGADAELDSESDSGPDASFGIDRMPDAAEVPEASSPNCHD